MYDYLGWIYIPIRLLYPSLRSSFLLRRGATCCQDRIGSEHTLVGKIARRRRTKQDIAPSILRLKKIESHRITQNQLLLFGQDQ
jgi:hypothetical protein